VNPGRLASPLDGKLSRRPESEPWGHWGTVDGPLVSGLASPRLKATLAQLRVLMTQLRVSITQPRVLITQSRVMMALPAPSMMEATPLPSIQS